MKLLEIIGGFVEITDKKYEYRHIETMQQHKYEHIEKMEWIKLIGKSLQFNRYTKDAISPVIGESCDKLVFPHNSGDTEIDFAMAKVIASNDNLELGDMETFRIRVDGLTHHNKQLKLQLSSEPGRFITGYVRDPAFDKTPNVYTEALTRQGWLNVKAKPTLKEGRIQALYIMDASRAEHP